MLFQGLRYFDLFAQAVAATFFAYFFGDTVTGRQPI